MRKKLYSFILRIKWILWKFGDWLAWRFSKMPIQYFWLTVKHKWYVLLGGLKLGGIPLWRLIIHDLSKFGRHEFPFYQQQFFGDKGDPKGFAAAWLHHQNYNPHHWEYWQTRSDHSHGGSKANTFGYLEMPETYIREMVADWMGASMAYTGSWDMTEWLKKGLQPLYVTHVNTRILVETILKEIGYMKVRMHHE